NPLTSGNNACAKYPPSKKTNPPINTVKTIARGTVLESFASSVYIVIASKPIKEKATTVAAVKTETISTFACHKGSRVKIVPVHIPLYNWTPPINIKTSIKIRVKTNKNKFKLKNYLILYILTQDNEMT